MDISVFKISSIQNNIFIDKSNSIRIKGNTNDSIESLGTILIRLNMGKPITHIFHVVPDEFNIETDGIIGKDFLIQNNCAIDYANMTFTVNSGNNYNVLCLKTGPSENSMIIPPRCETVRKFKVNRREDCVVDQIELSPGVYTARTIVDSNFPYKYLSNKYNR